MSRHEKEVDDIMCFLGFLRPLVSRGVRMGMRADEVFDALIEGLTNALRERERREKKQ